MSGTSRPDYGSYGGTEAKECGKINELTYINSPKANVITMIKQGDKLQIELDSNQTVIHAVHQGQVAGSITAASQTLLIECLKDGYLFTGKVIEIFGGRCQLRITCQGQA